MEKWADFLISKKKWKLNKKTIETFLVHNDLGDQVGMGTEQNRNWIIQKIDNGFTFRCIHKGEDGAWQRGSSLKKQVNGGLTWSDSLPDILTKRKTFISYYHRDDQIIKRKFKNLTSDLIINKSVEDGDIDANSKDEYIKQLIQKGFLSDTTILIILLGPKTKCRKHVDWEISGALNLKVGDNYSGLLGLKLPSHPDYGTGKYSYSEQPQRLTDNLKTGYAIIRDYTTDRRKLQEYIELAFTNRKLKLDKKTNSRIQLKNDLCN